MIVAAILTLLMTGPATAADGGVLVFGGTGRLGAEVVKLLVAADEDVTVFTRANSSRELLAGLKVDYAVGDLGDDASIAAAFDAHSYRAVVDASAERGGTRGRGGQSAASVPVRDSKGFYEKAMRSIASHAKRTGVKQFVLHGSVLAGDNIELFPRFAFLKGSTTLVDKGKAEKLLIESGVPYCIIRHGRVPNDPQPQPTGNAYLSTDQTIFADMTRGDLAMLTLDCLDNPARMNRVYHAYDPTFKMDRPLPTGPGDLRNRRGPEGANPEGANP